jgi:hypothetical protein
MDVVNIFLVCLKDASVWFCGLRSLKSTLPCRTWIFVDTYLIWKGPNIVCISRLYARVGKHPIKIYHHPLHMELRLPIGYLTVL